MGRPVAIVEDVVLELEHDRLKVALLLVNQDGQRIKGYLPEREVSTILPRSVLLDERLSAPLELLDTLASILKRLSLGRKVTHSIQGKRRRVSFLSWRPIRFTADAG